MSLTKAKKVDRRSAVDRKVSKPRHWHRKEDQLLRAAVAQYGNKHWKKIAEHVPGRNHTQCLQRWSKVLAPGLKKGQWSVFEDQLLVELAKGQMESCKILHTPSKFNWGIISKLIPGRTPKQCRERWVSNLNPEIKKGDWSAEEDKQILELNKLYPYKWATIAKNLKGRTENAVKIRFKSLTRTLERKRKRERMKQRSWGEKSNGSSSEDAVGSCPGSSPTSLQPVKRKAVKVKSEPGSVLNMSNATATVNGHTNQVTPAVGHTAEITLSLLDMYILQKDLVPFRYTASHNPSCAEPYLILNDASQPPVNGVKVEKSLPSDPTQSAHEAETTTTRSSRQRRSTEKHIYVRFNGAENWPNKYEMNQSGQLLGFPGCGTSEDSSFSVSVLVKDVEATRGKAFDVYVEFSLFDAEGSVKVDNILKKDDIHNLLRTKDRPGNAWIRGQFRSKAVRSGEIIYEYTIRTDREGWLYGDHFVDHPLAEAGAVNRHSLRAYVLFPFSDTGEYAQCIQIAKSPEFLILPEQHRLPGR